MSNDYNDKPHIKFINFYLDKNKLLEYFSDESYPYRLLGEFFKANDFTHRQYSGYISNKPLTNIDIADIAKKLGKKFTWLDDCMQKFDGSNAPKMLDLRKQIKGSAKIQKQQDLKTLEKEIKYLKRKLKDNNIPKTTITKSQKKILNLHKKLIKNKIEISPKMLKFIKSIQNSKNSKRDR